MMQAIFKEQKSDEPHAQFAESAKREQAIKANPRGIGYGG
jgi:hypothetical protein